MNAELTISTVDPRDSRKVLRLTLAATGLPASVIEAHVTGFLQFAQEMGLEFFPHWVAERSGAVVAACTCLKSAGRMAMLFIPPSSLIPRLLQPDPRIELIQRAAQAALATGTTQLVQGLVESGDPRAAQALSAAGFEHIAELIYLERVSRPGERSAITHDDDTGWLAYSDETHDAFARLLEETYVDSLDCPLMQGLRTTADIIDSHKAAGRFAPNHWHILQIDGRPAGCILLSQHPLRKVAEIVYLGVAPPFRRRGLGVRLLARALDLAHREQLEKVTVAVDRNNAPALKLYRRFQFTETQRRVAMIYGAPSTPARSG